MTDTERKRIDAICEVAGVKEIDDLSDGFHTFRQLYYQRMMLFATIVKQNKDKAWKSLRHEDGELCFGGGWFIVGIDTPEGSYTYHYEDNYFSLFDCEELECGKHWDGHTEKDVTRLLSLPSAQPYVSDANVGDMISRKAAIDIERNATVDTNPSHFEAHQKFTQFLDDAEVSSFGMWEWSNGFNTALTAVGVDLKRMPSAQPDGISLEWIDKHLEWLDNCDNDFAQLAKVGIKAMVEIWKKDKI